MKKYLKEYALVFTIMGISAISIGLSLFLLNGDFVSKIKGRLATTVINAVPSGSLISDVEFYSELVDAYNAEKGTSYGYDHNFTAAELASLHSLTLDELGPNYHGHSIESLSGLSYLTGLTSLKLKNLTVTDVSLNSNTSLESLVIDSVPLTELNLKRNSSLTSLEVNSSTINKLILANTNLSNIVLNTPTNTALVAVEPGKQVSYFSGTSSQDETISTDSFAITCGKYDLSVGESTKCYIKGKTGSTQFYGAVFKMVQSNQNISISNVALEANLSWESGIDYVLYGTFPVNNEFNIISFDLTGVSSGTTEVSLDDYDSTNPLSYIYKDGADFKFQEINEEISKTFSVNRYVVVNASDSIISSGRLLTDYVLKIANANGSYDPAFAIAVLGDVQVDGIINGLDVAKAYYYIGDGEHYYELTDAQILALDRNVDGEKEINDVNAICRDIGGTHE